MQEKIDLTGLGVEGFIGFSIKAKDTTENVAVHKAFRDYCKVETDDNYTQGLRKLLEYYQGDIKMEFIYQDILELKDRVALLEAKLEEANKPKPKEDEEMF